MTDVETMTRASHLWKQMTEGQRLRAAEAFWSEGETGAEHAEAVGLLSRRLNFRAKSVLALPVDKKAKYTASLVGVSDAVAARLLVTYHLTYQRQMMSAFLDALGIAHENGLIADDAQPTVDPDTLPGAVQILRDQYPPEDVAIYFATLRLQDPHAWAGLTDV